MSSDAVAELWVGFDDLYCNRVVAECRARGLRVSPILASDFGTVTGAISYGNRLQVMQADLAEVESVLHQLHREMYGEPGAS